MEPVEQIITAPGVPFPAQTVTEDGLRAARRSLREQIARLERELANAFVTAYPMGGPALPSHGGRRGRGYWTSVSSKRSATSSPSD